MSASNVHYINFWLPRNRSTMILLQQFKSTLTETESSWHNIKQEL